MLQHRLSLAEATAVVAVATAAAALPSTALARHHHRSRCGHITAKHHRRSCRRHHHRRHHHHPVPGAQVFQGGIRPVAFGPYGMVARRLDGDAQLVDGPRNDKLTVNVGGLAPGSSYAFALVSSPSGTSPCAAPSADARVAGFTYPALVSNPAGRAAAKAVSTSFAANPAVTYGVIIEDARQNILGCGVLLR